MYRVPEDGAPVVSAEWKEPRLKSGQRYVGLSISERYVSTQEMYISAAHLAFRRVFSCTSNGALRSTTLGEDTSAPSGQTSVLPMRLCDWRLSHDARSFAYGGDEVELSVWDTESAFAPREKSSDDNNTKKRKREDQLLPGEVWRAKNVCPTILLLYPGSDSVCPRCRTTDLASDSLFTILPSHICNLPALPPSIIYSQARITAMSADTTPALHVAL